MKTLLKKTGIVVATAAAALLAVSPLAFAGGKGGDCNIAQKIGDGTQTNAVSALNFNDLVDLNAAVPVCDNNVNLQVIPILSGNTQSIK